MVSGLAVSLAIAQDKFGKVQCFQVPLQSVAFFDLNEFPDIFGRRNRKALAAVYFFEAYFVKIFLRPFQKGHKPWINKLRRKGAGEMGMFVAIGKGKFAQKLAQYVPHGMVYQYFNVF